MSNQELYQHASINAALVVHQDTVVVHMDAPPPVPSWFAAEQASHLDLPLPLTQSQLTRLSIAQPIFQEALVCVLRCVKTDVQLEPVVVVTDVVTRVVPL
eukprot:gene4074-4746_t